MAPSKLTIGAQSTVTTSRGIPKQWPSAQVHHSKLTDKAARRDFGQEV